MPIIPFEEKLSFESKSYGFQCVAQQKPLAFEVKTGFKVREKCNMPNLYEPQTIKHFTRLSNQNFSIDSNFYPLGSCTMKYNPKINEKTARLQGFSSLHPLQNENTIQGALKMIYTLKNWLCELTGLEDVTLNPAAGAQGEFAGIMCIKKYFQSRGELQRKYIIVPESAHGTNPASAVMCGFSIISVPLAKSGLTDSEKIKEAVEKYGNEIAGIMLTNPSTCGLFEKDV